jgi:hypothetical protein
MSDMETGYANAAQCAQLLSEARKDGCLFCKWFAMHEEATATKSATFKHITLLEVHGDCRRRAPIVQLHEEDPDSNLTVWPEVTQKEWCGEFEKTTEIIDVDYICSPTTDPGFREWITEQAMK